MRFLGPAAMLIIVAGTVARPAAADGAIVDWPYYGGDAGGSRYSPLTQIDRSNVAELKPAWEYHTGDISDGSDNRRKSEFEATPIVADGTMYFSTPFNRVVALDPETGREKWSFDPKIDLHARYSEGLVSRALRRGSMPREPRAMRATSGSFWRPSMHDFSPLMAGRGSSAKISAPQVKST
jgi:glucose dehydrogenase